MNVHLAPLDMSIPMPAYRDIATRFADDFARAAGTPDMIGKMYEVAGKYYRGIKDKGDNSHDSTIWNHIHRTRDYIRIYCEANDVPAEIHHYLDALMIGHELFDLKKDARTQRAINPEYIIKTWDLDREFVADLVAMGTLPGQGYINYGTQVTSRVMSAFAKVVGDLPDHKSTIRLPVPEQNQSQRFRDKKDYLYDGLELLSRAVLSGKVKPGTPFDEFLLYNAKVPQYLSNMDVIMRNTHDPIIKRNWGEQFMTSIMHLIPMRGMPVPAAALR